MRSEIKLLNEDCMPALRKMEDNQFDLALVDPPYFAEYGKEIFPGAEISTTGVKRHRFESKHWDIPTQEYFDELFRVSKEQIIWGCNYYARFIPHVSRIVWDKENDSSSFSKCEIASKSMNIGVDIFRFMWNGMLQGNMKEKEIRIHPTQKPVALYKYLLQNYAKEGDKILDTHGGSMSIAIACWDLGFDLDLYEIDKEYFDNGKLRLERHQAQGQLF